MAGQTKIEWTDASLSPIRARVTGADGAVKTGWHCRHVDEGCTGCYAEAMNLWRGTGLPYKPGHEAPRGPVEVYLDQRMLTQALRWRDPRRIFLNSMSDTFGEFVTDDMLDQMFAVMALTPHHTWQVLTKRPERARKMLTAVRRPGLPERMTGVLARMFLDGQISREQHEATYRLPFTCLPNVWLGTSISDQSSADRRIPDLLATPAAVRFLSAEPLLGPVDLTMIQFLNERGGQEEWDALDLHLHPDWEDAAQDEVTGTLDWVICGGESGARARPMHLAWARRLRDQCVATGVPFFFKQVGEWAWRGDLADGGERFERVGKKAAGRLLDGREWNEGPG